MFQNGCPMCGYCAPAPEKAPKPRETKSSHSPSSPLPFWSYIAAAIVLLTVISLFSYFLTK